VGIKKKKTFQSLSNRGVDVSPDNKKKGKGIPSLGGGDPPDKGGGVTGIPHHRGGACFQERALAKRKRELSDKSFEGEKERISFAKRGGRGRGKGAASI